MQRECMEIPVEPAPGGIQIPPAVLELIRTHARAAYPEECCGALVGRPGRASGVGRVAGAGGGESVRGAAGPGDERWRVRAVVRAVPLENREPGDRGRGYRIPAAAVRAVEAAAEREGLAVVGFYHSHPRGAPEPSPVDREQAWPWYSYVIVAAAPDGAMRVRSWRLREDRRDFAAETLLCEEEIE